MITLDMDTIINSSFNKHPMSWKLIHYCLIHTSESFTKEMCRHHTLTAIQKQRPKKINEAPCTVIFTK